MSQLSPVCNGRIILDSLLQYTMTLLQGLEDPVLSTLMYKKFSLYSRGIKCIIDVKVYQKIFQFFWSILKKGEFLKTIYLYMRLWLLGKLTLKLISMLSSVIKNRLEINSLEGEVNWNLIIECHMNTQWNTICSITRVTSLIFLQASEFST